MTEVLKKILQRLSKDTLILIVLGMGFYIYNEKTNKKDETDLARMVKLQNKIFYLSLDVDSIKSK